MLRINSRTISTTTQRTSRADGADEVSPVEDGVRQVVYQEEERRYCEEDSKRVP